MTRRVRLTQVSPANWFISFRFLLSTNHLTRGWRDAGAQTTLEREPCLSPRTKETNAEQARTPGEALPCAHAGAGAHDDGGARLPARPKTIVASRTLSI